MSLTEEKLRQMLTDLEADNVERTRAFDKADKMGQAICAFANDLPGRNEPGYLLLGVENDGRISGKRIDDDHLTSLGGLKTEGNLLPPPAMALEVFHFPEGDVAVITVFPSAYPPIRFQGQVWIRVGARKALATEEDINVLEERRQKSARRFEEQPCMSARLEDLDLGLFRNIYLPRAIQAEIVEEDNRPIQEQLAALRFYDRVAQAPTNLGVILFGKHPERFIPSAYLQYVKFSSLDNGGNVLAEHPYRGPLLKTIFELESFVKVGIASPHPVRISALQEKTAYVYPEWSMRELLLNAIIHGDYQIGNAPIKFYDYNGTRLEITNSGGLYGRANPDNFPYTNDYRNPNLAEAMKVMGFVNKYNMGIAKVKNEMAANGNPIPIFDVNKLTEFRVTLRPACDIVDITSQIGGNSEITGGNGEVNGGNGEVNGEIKPQNGEINGRSGEVNGRSGEVNGGNDEVSGEINGKSGEIKPQSGEVNGEINGKSGEVNGRSGEVTGGNGGITGGNGGITGGNGGITGGNGKLRTLSRAESQKLIEQKIITAIGNHPGIKGEGLLLETRIPLRTIERTLKCLKNEKMPKIEYRGTKRTGGWFIKS